MFADLGGMAGLAALLTALVGVLAQLRQTRKLREDTAQLQPDHGSSVADIVTSTATDVREVRRMLGHEIGEVRDELVDVKARLRRLEGADHSTALGPPADAIATSQLDAVSARDARAEIGFFFEQLLARDPSLLGGKLPDDGFFGA